QLARANLQIEPVTAPRWFGVGKAQDGGLVVGVENVALEFTQEQRQFRWVIRDANDDVLHPPVVAESMRGSFGALDETFPKRLDAFDVDVRRWFGNDHRPVFRLVRLGQSDDLRVEWVAFAELNPIRVVFAALGREDWRAGGGGCGGEEKG